MLIRKQALFLYLLLFCSTASFGQHYQRVISDITGCTTLSCIQQLRQQHKPLQKNKPVQKTFTPNLIRYQLDYDWYQGAETKENRRHFRLSLLVQGDSIHFGQLEQLDSQYQLEATYLYRNNEAFIEKELQAYNKQHNANKSYRDIINLAIVRFPPFWQSLH